MTPQLNMLARILADERTAQLRQINEYAWMREEIEEDAPHRPIRPAGVILAILVLAVFGQMMLA